MSLEDSLIRLAVAGDRGAQRLVYESLVDSIGQLVSQVVDATDVDDVIQDAFLHVFRELSSFRFESEFTTWVYRIALNDALQHLRRKHRRQMLPMKNVEMFVHEAESHIEANEMLNLALSKLDPELRVILHLKVVQDESYATIAKILNIRTFHVRFCGNGRISAQSGTWRVEERAAGPWLGRLK
ncbi:MAG: sigma-70 family RNA polymerase sigma factor [Planctomyces sp.]|nr:sigma-70 family RNA polymerase sigma factor [Planctomyces sp.]